MSSPLTMNFVVDERLDAYRTIFNHAWARELLAMVDGTKLDPPLFELTLNWRAAVNTHAFPWMMIKALEGLWHGAIKDRGFAPKFVGLMAKDVPRRMEGKMTNMARKRLAQVLEELAAEIQSSIERDPEAELDSETIWEHFWDDEMWEFRVAIWGSQRFCFGALYHAYENYLREVLAIKRGNPTYRFSNFSELVDHTTAAFGQGIADKCLGGEFLEITRLVRNSLAHNGGKESKQLADLRKAKEYGIGVESGFLQITAPHNESLISALEKRVKILTEEALKQPEFR